MCPYPCSWLSVGAFALAAVVTNRAVSHWLNARRLRQLTAARRRQHLEAKERFAARFRDRQITEKQRDILRLEFHELRARLQEGSLTAVEVLEAYQAQAVAVDAETNAVVEYLEDATARAVGLDSLPREARGPLHGIPVSLKVYRRKI